MSSPVAYNGKVSAISEGVLIYRTQGHVVALAGGVK